jgi:hypothetical protein
MQIPVFCKGENFMGFVRWWWKGGESLRSNCDWIVVSATSDHPRWARKINTKMGFYLAVKKPAFFACMTRKRILFVLYRFCVVGILKTIGRKRVFWDFYMDKFDIISFKVFHLLLFLRTPLQWPSHNWRSRISSAVIENDAPKYAVFAPRVFSLSQSTNFWFIRVFCECGFDVLSGGSFSLSFYGVLIPKWNLKSWH